MTGDEMVAWHHRLNGHESEQATADGEGQGSLVCCSPWGRKELEMNEQLNDTSDSIIATAVDNSFQSRPTLCNPMDCSPQGSSVHGIRQARITGVGCYAPLPRDHPCPGIEPVSLMSPHWQVGSLPPLSPGKPH